MTARLPWFRVYVDELLDLAIEAMPPAAYGAHERLRRLAWRAPRPGHLPNDPARLAVLSRLGVDGWAEHGPVILPAWSVSEDGSEIIAPDLVSQAAEAASRGDQARAAARKSVDARRSTGAQRPLSARSAPADDRLSSQSRADQNNTENFPPTPQGDSPRPATPLAAEPRKKSRSRRPPDPSAAELRAYYLTRWVDLRRPIDGKPPHLDAADNRAAIALVELHGLDAARGYIDRYLVDSDPWLVSTGHRLRHLPSRVDAYRARPARTGPVLPKYEDLLKELGI